VAGALTIAPGAPRPASSETPPRRTDGALSDSVPARVHVTASGGPAPERGVAPLNTRVTSVVTARVPHRGVGLDTVRLTTPARIAGEIARGNVRVEAVDAAALDIDVNVRERAGGAWWRGSRGGRVSVIQAGGRRLDAWPDVLQPGIQELGRYPVRAAQRPAPLFAPEAVHVYGATAYFVRRNEVLQVTAPFRQPPVVGRGRREAFVVGERGVEALRITGPQAHEIALPRAGYAMPGWDRLRIDTASAGRFTATPVGRRRPGARPALDSVTIAVERLVFSGIGAVRLAPVTRPSLVSPP
jgi:hypothetical protein